jgi:hypothetical protein
MQVVCDLPDLLHEFQFAHRLLAQERDADKSRHVVNGAGGDGAMSFET